MTHDLHRRTVRIEGLDLRLSGVEPRMAREVAAALPAALTAALAAGTGRAGADAGDRDLDLPRGGAGDVTRALAREIAARIRARIDHGEDR